MQFQNFSELNRWQSVPLIREFNPTNQWFFINFYIWHPQIVDALEGSLKVPISYILLLFFSGEGNSVCLIPSLPCVLLSSLKHSTTLAAFLCSLRQTVHQMGQPSLYCRLLPINKRLGGECYNGERRVQLTKDEESHYNKEINKIMQNAEEWGLLCPLQHIYKLMALMIEIDFRIWMKLD